MADQYEYEFLDGIAPVPASSAWVELDQHYIAQGEEMYNAGLAPRFIGPYPAAILRCKPSSSSHMVCVTWGRVSGIVVIGNKYGILGYFSGFGWPCYSAAVNVLGTERVLVSYRSRQHKFRLTLGYMQYKVDRAYFQPILAIEVTPADSAANLVLWPRMEHRSGRVLILVNVSGTRAIEFLPDRAQWAENIPELDLT